MSGQGGGGDPPHRIPPQPNPFWDNLAEQRLNYITSRLQELAAQLADTAKEIRAQIRISDQQGGALTRYEERLRDLERELQELPKRLEKLAPFDWAQRMDTRLNNIEDEGRSPFVRKGEFDPVKKVVFGLVSTICLGVLAAVAKLIMK